MNEEWRDVGGSSTYQVSDRGRVRNKYTRYILKQRRRSETGTMTVRLWVGGTRMTFAVRALQSEVFWNGRY